MESAIISIVSVGLVIVGALTIMMNSFSSVSSLADSWIKMEEKAEEIRRTDISVTPPDTYAGGNIELLVSNDGQTDLSDFSHWDVITRYQSGGIAYISYTDEASPGDNQWTFEGIFLSDNVSNPEIFDPDILNPGETAKLEIKLNPQINPGETSRITTSTSSGVTAVSDVSRQ